MNDIISNSHNCIVSGTDNQEKVLKKKCLKNFNLSPQLFDDLFYLN